MSKKIKKVLIVTNIPTPYRIPLFNELKKQLQEKNIGFKVIFGGNTYSRRKWKIDLGQCHFDYSILNSRTIKLGSKEKTMFFYSGLTKKILEIKPDLIVTIGFSWATLKVFFLSFFNNYKFIIWSGSISGRSYSLLRKIFRRILLRKASGFIAYGTKAKEYLISLGADEKKIHISLNTTDTDFYAKRSKEIRDSCNFDKTKKKLLYIGYLSSRKNVRKLLEAMIDLKKQRNDFILDIVGSGSEKSSLESFVKKNSLNDHVIFNGYKQKEEIPFFLAQCDCFLFQTDFDIWGLVLNEALAAAVPCISSINAGATFDLIREGVTGFALDFSDLRSLTEKINWILDHPEKAMQIGAKAAEFIKNKANIKKSTADFVAALTTQLE